jgi:hypothetical protein
MDPRARRRALSLLALLALGAVGIGVASILLLPAAGPSAPPGGPGSFSGTSVNFLTAGEVIGVLAFGMVLLFVYMRFAGPGGVVPKRFLSLLLVYFLVSVSFLALVHLVGPSIVPAGSMTGTGNDTGTPGNTSMSGNGSGTNNSTIVYPHYSATFWLVVGGAAVVTVVGLVLAVWYLGRPSTQARGRGDPDPVGEAFERALRSLDAATDPRAVLIALYAQLLARIAGRLPELDAATPREIERACVEEFGIPPAPAAELRALFERARYSTLPLDDADVARARTALRDALDGLRAPQRSSP